MRIQYYLIHGMDPERGDRMKNEFKTWGLENTKVKWIIKPNKEDITEDMRSRFVEQGASMTNGQVSCTYKHFLCVQDVVENNHEYGIIMEDNQYFCGPIEKTVDKYIDQLNSMYPGWDIIFDTKWKKVQEIGEVNMVEGVFVYPKSNDITNHCHGGTRLAQFYIITNQCAKKMYDHYIPFHHNPDHWMNDLFRRLKIKSFWSEPSISDIFPHVSTVS